MVEPLPDLVDSITRLVRQELGERSPIQVPGRLHSLRLGLISAARVVEWLGSLQKVNTRSNIPIGLHEHRDIQGGAARAAVFGVSDGLVSNVGLILGVAGASTNAAAVQVAGLAGLVAGAISMAAGEYNSMRVQSELFEREIELERAEIARNPGGEAMEMVHRYQALGVDPDLARKLAADLMSKPEVALEFHTREEIGVSPDELGSPVVAATASLGAFAIGAVVPLLPWFFVDGSLGILLSIVLALTSAVAIGLGITVFTEGSRIRAVIRQVLFTAIPALITFLIGSLIGAGIS